ncbi:hypothetical protein [Nocardiopsis dassonvillei]|uniref:hypothetical protein n=1 Tax=Nocardiopsis dassonvillei TaxID=2014 RepID=UPI00363BBCD4
MFPRAARLSGARADSRSALGLPGGMSRRRMLALTGTAAAAGALGAAPASAAERTWRVTGEDVAPLAHFDGVMKDYMQARGITAGSLAVARNGRSISTVFEQPETGGGATHYGLGWSVRPTGSGENTWHTGSMPGTYTFLARSNGYTVVALFNRRDEGDALNWGEIDPKLWDAVNEVGTWPTEDLTPIYF